MPLLFFFSVASPLLSPMLPSLRILASPSLSSFLPWLVEPCLASLPFSHSLSFALGYGGFDCGRGSRWFNLGCGYWWFNRSCGRLWVHGFVVGLILEWVMVGSWWLKFCGVFFFFFCSRVVLVGMGGREEKEMEKKNKR